ncbi:hypothetical protein BDA96_05G172100 [Sorghum bicolor]|uniref:Uncharacterized protein n=2 Tax=Sorghum bicolor TaxID=4558 RepID=A0A921UFQ9_SORBI|nr:hypothetical protein BDA96_05G172100 [Sorghum bicolor]OQU83673.1 hypothetical protein SORBI_3005G158100 [Sorghum bicolor]
MVGSATPPTYSPQGEPRGGSRRAPSPSVWDWGFSDLRRCNNDLEARRDRVLAGLGLLHIRHLRVLGHPMLEIMPLLVSRAMISKRLVAVEGN